MDDELRYAVEVPNALSLLAYWDRGATVKGLQEVPERLRPPVVAWTAFPRAFASAAATLIIPLTLAAVGIIFRGAAFAFRKSLPGGPGRQLFGIIFAVSSLLTPFFLGTVAGALASGRIPYGGYGDFLTSWANPTSLFAGLLAMLICAYLAAVYLTADARRVGDDDLAEGFRRQALAVGAVLLVPSLVWLYLIFQRNDRSPSDRPQSTSRRAPGPNR